MNHDAEMDAITKRLVAAGLLELFTDDDGDEAMRLTPEGERVARQLAMTDEAGQDALLAAPPNRASPPQPSLRRRPPRCPR